MTFDSFLHKIPEIKRLKPLGFSAQAIMMPANRQKLSYIDEQLHKNARQSAVMMLLYPKDKQMSILLIQRALSTGVHSGQIGFPGGARDKEDKNLQDTALRETQEEIGVDPRSVQDIKAFTKLYIPASNYIVQPFLGVLTQSPIITCNYDEVAGIIELPVKDLLSSNIIQHVGRTTSYGTYLDVPAFVYQDSIIWGATAMMLSELREALKTLYGLS